VTRRPDFLILGAMKSGTSTLAAQLSEQPGIFMSTPKEPNFFSDDAVYAQGLDWYGALFDGAAPGDLCGEASTHYTKLPTYPDTIARAHGALAAPKLIYIIRNPIDRAVSHVIHEWSQGGMGSDVVAALDTHPEIVAYGRYAMQIAPWIEAFGADAVHLTSLEAMQADPQGVLAAAAAFIGHPGPVTWVDARARENVSAERIRRLPLQGLLVDNPVAAALRRTLVPQSVRDWVKGRRQMQVRPELPAALRQSLADQFAEDHAALEALFPGHPALRHCYPFLVDIPETTALSEKGPTAR
jgi:hypothetical protein